MTDAAGPARAAALASCCTVGVDGVIDEATAQSVARTFKALADPARVRLLSLIASSPDGEACGCDLTGPVGLAQPTVSHHLKVLVEAGLVKREQRGRWAYFSLAPDALAEAEPDPPAVRGS